MNETVVNQIFVNYDMKFGNPGKRGVCIKDIIEVSISKTKYGTFFDQILMYSNVYFCYLPNTH